MMNVSRSSVAFLLVAFLSGCGGGGSGSSDSASHPNPPPASDPVTVAISPADNQTVPAGGTIQFKATVRNTSEQAVTWQVNGAAGGNDTVGTITSDGLYTAPKAPPLGGSVTVAAVSQAGSGASASTVVAITFSNASLDGDYIFDLSAVSSSGDFAVLGRVHADGHGNLAGIEDYNGPEGVFEDESFNGSYSVGPDGTGTATLSGAHGPSALRLLVITPTDAEVMEADNTAVGTGELVAQEDVGGVAASLNDSNYIFSLSSFNEGGSQTAIVGLVRPAGAGALAGEEDRNDGGAVSAKAAVSGSYSVDAGGKGTATFTDSKGTVRYRLYAASDDDIKFLSLDPSVPLNGEAQQQVADTFGGKNLAGNYVFALAGENAQGDVATAGRFSADGAGHVSSGVEDRNAAGVISADRTFEGSYSVDTDGRGQATWTSSAGTETYTFYVVSDQASVWLENNAAGSTGSAYSQAGHFSTAAVNGHFGFFGAAIDNANPSATIGVIEADSAGGISGSEIVGKAGNLSPLLDLTGTYAVQSNGRGTASLTTNGGTTSNYVLYGVAPQGFLLLGTDPGMAAVGLMAQQY